MRRLTVSLLFLCFFFFNINNFNISAAMIKIAGVKSNDKINFKEFVDFFNKID
jgi:hypothetical protein